MGLIKTVSGSVMAGLFIVCILVFAINFSIDNRSEITLDNSSFSELKDDLSSDMGQINTDFNQSKNIFEDTSVSENQEHSEGGGQFKVGPTTALSMVTKSLTLSFKTIAGSEFNFIIQAVIALLVLILALYGFKAWFGRDPE